MIESRATNIKIAAIAALTFALFSADFIFLIRQSIIGAGITSLTCFVLLAPIFLLYKKRDILPITASMTQFIPQKTQRFSKIAGILIVAFAILLMWYGSYSNITLTYHFIALPIFVAGLTLSLFNFETLKRIWVPLALFLLLVPMPFYFLNAVTTFLSNLTVHTSLTIVNSLGIAANSIPGTNSQLMSVQTAYGTPLEFTISYSLVYCIQFAIAFLLTSIYLVRSTLPKKIAFALLTIPLLFFGNIFRVTILAIISHFYGASLGTFIYRLFGGWVLGLAVTLIVVFLAQRNLKINKIDNRKTDDKTNNRNSGNMVGSKFVAKQDLVVLSIILIMLIPFFFVQTAYYDLNGDKPSAITVGTVTGIRTQGDLFPNIPNYKIDFVRRDTAQENTSKEDVALVNQVSLVNASKSPFLLSVEISTRKIPSWQDSLINIPNQWGMDTEVKQINLLSSQLSTKENAHYFTFQYNKTGQLESVLYWYEFVGCQINGSFSFKWLEVSLIAFPNSVQEFDSIQTEMLYIANNISNYWQSYNESSSATIVVANFGFVLLAALTLATLLVLIAYQIEESKRKKNLTKAFFKLSTINKEIVKALSQNNDRKIISEKDLTEKLRTQQITLNESEVLNHLYELQKLGLLQATLNGSNNQPVVFESTINFYGKMN